MAHPMHYFWERMEMEKVGLLKEAAAARDKLTLHELNAALGKQEARLGIMKQAAVFMSGDLARAEASIEDLKERISREEVRIRKVAAKSILDIAVGI